MTVLIILFGRGVNQVRVERWGTGAAAVTVTVALAMIAVAESVARRPAGVVPPESQTAPPGLLPLCHHGRRATGDPAADTVRIRRAMSAAGRTQCASTTHVSVCRDVGNRLQQPHCTHLAARFEAPADLAQKLP